VYALGHDTDKLHEVGVHRFAGEPATHVWLTVRTVELKASRVVLLRILQDATEPRPTIGLTRADSTCYEQQNSEKRV